MPVMTVSLMLDTDDDATFDAAMEAMEDFAKGELKEILSTLDPRAFVHIRTTEGDSFPC